MARWAGLAGAWAGAWWWAGAGAAELGLGWVVAGGYTLGLAGRFVLGYGVVDLLIPEAEIGL